MANSADAIRIDITTKIVDSLKQGTPPWRRPWKNNPNAGMPSNFQTKKRYTGINILILMGASIQQDFKSRHWGSSSAVLNQIGAHVKKGEKASFVTFFKMLPKLNENGSVDKDKNGNDRVIPLLRQYALFNIEQFQSPTVEMLLDGRGTYNVVKALLGQFDKLNRTQITSESELRSIAAKYLPISEQPAQGEKREVIAEAICQGIHRNLSFYRADVEVKQVEPNFDPAEKLIAQSGAVIKHGGDKAMYIPTQDSICIPVKSSFDSMTDYYLTVFHELAHWTKLDQRVGRSLKFESQTENYAYEELVAELAACFTLMEVGVPMAESTMHKSQGYLSSWLKAMQNDPKYIFSAATQASKITDYLLSFIGKQNQSNCYEDTNDLIDKDVA